MIYIPGRPGFGTDRASFNLAREPAPVYPMPGLEITGSV